LIEKLARSHDALVTVEENVVLGGAGSACREVLDELGIERPLLHLGLPDRFVDHGDPARLLASVGLDAAGIEASIRARFGELLRETRRVRPAA
jgi:1-deoxy-D-xylulose-5-phosphate synthase